jgi:hypothetical protein
MSHSGVGLLTLANIHEDEVGKISDGYHTFDELYEHRVVLFIALCKMCYLPNDVWRSEIHSDGSRYDGWFVMGINKEPGQQITYHLPMREWPNTEFAETLERAPRWDEHNSNDVIKRLRDL